MLYDGTFEKIAKKWELTDSMCLSMDDKTYVAGGKVPEPDTSKLTKKSEDTQADDAAAESAGTVKKQGIGQIVKQLGQGMLATLGIFFFTLLFSMPLGLLVMAVRMSKIKPLQWIAKIYISIMRGTPLMLQLLVVFFAPYYLFGISTSYQYRFYAVLIGFSLIYAAYFAEIFRGGIESIPRGQYEAAAALGMTKAQTFFRIILPQVIKRIVPASSNEVITLVKDTSLANVVAYSEIMLAAKQQMMNYSSLVPLFIAGVFYFVMATVLTALFGFIEKKLNYYR